MGEYNFCSTTFWCNDHETEGYVDGEDSGEDDEGECEACVEAFEIRTALQEPLPVFVCEDELSKKLPQSIVGMYAVEYKPLFPSDITSIITKYATEIIDAKS
jgi:hypothetical protein